MGKNIKYILWIITAFLVQVLISEYVNVWPMLYIAIYPLFLLILPVNMNIAVYMLIAFAFGLGIDSLSDGILGLNAAACVAMAYFRAPVMGILLKRSTIENMNEINSKELQMKRFVLLTLFMYTLFFLVYITLDNLWSTPSFFIFVRLVINIAVNVLLAFVIETTLISRFIIKYRG